MARFSIAFRLLIRSCLFVSLLLSQGGESLQYVNVLDHFRPTEMELKDQSVLEGSEDHWMYAHHLKSCSEEELFQRIKRISDSPAITNHTKEILIQLEKAYISKLGGGTLSHFHW